MKDKILEIIEAYSRDYRDMKMSETELKLMLVSLIEEIEYVKQTDTMIAMHGRDNV